MATRNQRTFPGLDPSDTAVVVDAVSSTSASLGLSDNQTLFAKGRDAALDGGEGIFVFSASSAATVDGGIVFTGPGGVGRLLRQGYTVLGFNGEADARWYGVKADFVSYSSVGTDNAAALALIATALNAGSLKTVRFPHGAMHTTAGLPHLTKPAVLLGHGGQKTRFYLATTMVGDMFSFGECWNFNEYNSTTPPAIDSKPGGQVRGINVVGAGVNTAQTGGVYNLQRGLALYDRCDSFEIEDFSCDTLTGSAIRTGYTKNTAFGFIRVCNFFNIRVKSSGIAQTEAVLDLFSEGSGDSTNQCNFYDIKVVYPYSPALRIHCSNTDIGIRNLNFFGMMMHGVVNPSPAINCNLVEIGSTTYAGKVSAIRMSGYSGAASYLGYHAFAILAVSSASCPYGIQIDGGISSGAGGGFNIQFGKQIQLNLNDVSVDQNALTVGAGVSGNVYLAGWAWEHGPVSGASAVVIDAAAKDFVRLPLQGMGAPNGTQTISAQAADSTTVGGNARGANAVDLQTSRANANQVASGSNSTISGGVSGKASGANSTVIGGNACDASGPSSISGGFDCTADADYTVTLGRGAHSRSRKGVSLHASGSLATNGDAQSNRITLRAQSTSATPVVPTADGAAVSATNINNLNRANQCQAITGTVLAYCAATGDAAHWTFTVLIKRTGSNVNTTAIVGTPTITKLYGDSGTSGWTGPDLTADTTNGGLKVSCTGAASTTITWVCELRGPESMG